MGLGQSSENLTEYKVHERVGVYRHVHLDGENLIELLRQLPSEKVYADWAQRVKELTLSKLGADLIYLPLKHGYSKTELCGSGGSLKMVFDEWENFLKDEINSRRKNQNPYTEEELWFILYSLVRVGVVYERRGAKLGDLHPNNVVVTPQGFIRVITVDSLPLELDNFQKILEEIKTDVYLAPEEMEAAMLESGVYTVRDPSRADVFSFGVTMLETTTLENCSYLYIRNPIRVSPDKLQSYAALLKDKYSQALYQVVMSALEITPAKRISFLKLYEMLRPHEEKILQLSPFSLGSSVSRLVDFNRGSQSAQSLSKLQKSSNSSGQVAAKAMPFSPPSQEFFGFSKRQ